MRPHTRTCTLCVAMCECELLLSSSLILFFLCLMLAMIDHWTASQSLVALVSNAAKSVRSNLVGSEVGFSIELDQPHSMTLLTVSRSEIALLIMFHHQ
mmetsp:Transcript_92301/g.202156  ORF Transcript_92301/g.202156 Transcript_92301/m.202156 type:complete len:98 (-) Transcript_92301:119-412(-)